MRSSTNIVRFGKTITGCRTGWPGLARTINCHCVWPRLCGFSVVSHHEVRLRHCGEDVEVEGIISIKTGGCPEDCHFCSQSGLFDSPVRGVWLDIPELVKAAKETAATGATVFCIVAAVRGPDIKLMNQIKFAIDRINEAVHRLLPAAASRL